jgi:hypothetical protein
VTLGFIAVGISMLVASVLLLYAFRRPTQHLAVLALTLLACSPEARSGSGDEERLRALHEEVLRAHRESDIDLLLDAEEDAYVIASEGQVSHPDRNARRGSLGPYLEATRFSVYRDQIPPVVKVAKDGSLGWVIAQIEAKGEQTAPDGTVVPVDFVSSWIELYEKRGGRWVRVGNVSNFKPSRGGDG